MLTWAYHLLKVRFNAKFYQITPLLTAHYSPLPFNLSFSQFNYLTLLIKINNPLQVLVQDIYDMVYFFFFEKYFLMNQQFQVVAEFIRNEHK